MLAGIESECRPDSRRNGGRFPVGIMAGFARSTKLPTLILNLHLHLQQPSQDRRRL